MPLSRFNRRRALLLPAIVLLLLAAALAKIVLRAPQSRTLRVHADLISRSDDDADVVLPTTTLEETFELEGDGWMFRPNGNIQLSGATSFWNRLTFFPSRRGAGAGVVSFRYRTQGQGAQDHALSFVVHERSDAARRHRIEAVIRSDARALIRYSEIDDDGRLVEESILAEAEIPHTNGDWRAYELDVDHRSLELRIDDVVVLTHEIDSRWMDEVALDGAWGLELSRQGSSIYPSDALLRRLEIVREPQGNGEPLTVLAFRRDPEAGEAALHYLNFKYARSRSYLRRHAYWIKQVGIPLAAHQTEYFPALLAPPGSIYRFRLSVAPGDRLRGRYGLYQEASSPDSQPASTFEIRVVGDAGSTPQLLHTDTVSPPSSGFRDVDIPLPIERSGDVVLELAVRGPRGEETPLAIGLWGTPLVMRPSPPIEPRRPNVIVISLDTLRRDHARMLEPSALELLPNLAALVRDGTVFENAYSVSPWTMPSHFSMLSGRYPSMHGLNRAFGTNGAASEDVETLARLLAREGYVTAAIASDHSLDPINGFDNGFHSFLDNEVRVASPLMPALERFLESHADDEFFLFFHSYDPHAPIPTGPSVAANVRWGKDLEYNDFLELGDATADEKKAVHDLYAKRVQAYDAIFGNVLELLRRHRLDESSIVVFTSDHGEELFEHGAYQHGHSLYEELLQVPLIVKFPSGNDMPARAENLTASIDIVPTLLDYLGIEAPADLDGTSFLPVLEGREKAHRRYLLAEALAWGPERKAVITDRYKYIVTYADSDLPQLLPRTSTYDALFDTTPGEELYDLRQDPGERINIVDDHAELAGRLHELLRPLIEATPRSRGGIEKDSERMELLRSLGYVK